MPNILIHPSVVKIAKVKNTSESTPVIADAIHSALWLLPKVPIKNIITVDTVSNMPMTNGTTDLLLNSTNLLYSQFPISIVFAESNRIYQIRRNK